MYNVTYLDIRHSTKHLVRVSAANRFIAERNAWDLFTLLRESRRYGTPSKDDFAIYSVTEISDDAPPEEHPLESDTSDPRDA